MNNFNIGCSVTQLIKKVKQPYGGYIPVKTMNIIEVNDGITVNIEDENINAGLVGLAVDYLSRFMVEKKELNLKSEAFAISLMGSKIINQSHEAQIMLKKIIGLDSTSIKMACKLASYDVCYRMSPFYYKELTEFDISDQTVMNIKTMVERTLLFFDKYGPVTKHGMTFEGGYTNIVSSGDADFMTKDTLWDLKVSKNPPNSSATFQILIYYILGKHSVHKEFNDLKYIGIFNPRSNLIYQKKISEIDCKTISYIESDVMGYKK